MFGANQIIKPLRDAHHMRRGVSLSAGLHLAVLLALSNEYPFLTGEPPLDPITVELVILEPEPREPEPVPREPALRPRPEAESGLKNADDPSRLLNPLGAAVTQKAEVPAARERPPEPAADGNAPTADAQPPAAAASLRSGEETAAEASELARLPDPAQNGAQDLGLSFAELSGCDKRQADAPKVSFTYDEVAPTNGSQFARLALSAQVNGDFAKAVEFYDAAVRARDLSLDDLAKVYNNRGAAYRNLGLHELAVDDYTQAIRTRPGYAAALINRGIARYMEGLYEPAVKDFSAAINADAGRAKPYYYRGLIFALAGRHEHAIADFSQAIRLAPCFDDAYFDRGHLYEALGDHERSLVDFKKSYALDPENRDYRAKLQAIGLLH